MLLITPIRDHLYDVPSIHGDILYFPTSRLFVAAIPRNFSTKSWIDAHEGAWIDTAHSFVLFTDDILTITFVDRYLFSTFNASLYLIGSDFYTGINMPYLSYAHLVHWLRPFGLDRDVHRHILT